ncbi:GNAT family N-acetyltransferase [Salegentibacter chungangensis]|uniref:GNAT family N-acetyltransferase n=1 Tax=Salegentibacter chungangensis TaxID=1335724 RepID=A0ABW3NTZ9_9FLAO
MIRDFSPKDSETLLELVKLNIPEYFDETEWPQFKEYLEHETEDYYVIEENGKIIGSGGLNYSPQKKRAVLSWDVLHPRHQGRGHGRKLVQYRIERARQRKGVEDLIVRTSQLTYKFYEKMGFDLEQVEKDFWAKGYDLYFMKMSLK